MTQQTTCRQCGTCCRKGGPSFHLSDKHLIDSGKIPARFLFTLRCGELAHENIQGKVAPVTTDLIKIKGKNGTWTCVFLNEETNQCGIYENRPAECRALMCWDPCDIKAIYHHQRLTRKDLLQNVTGLWELVKTHQARCDYGVILDLIQKIRNRSNRTLHNQLKEMIAYDTQIRTLATERSGINKELTDFLFGRPLTTTLPPLFTLHPSSPTL
ncbi:MAG: YkgJ family cysteine cluster protein [Desulfobacterales bacterium]|nr:YkgJ family cysteine cluster protein [Desulfobacterales bacterium]